MTTFFMPLGGVSNWDNNEVRYLLRSLEKNFKDFNFITYAEKIPTWLTIEHKLIPRYYPERLLRIYKTKQYENYIDVLNKVYQFVHFNDCPEEFVYIYDDTILLKEITQKEILNIPQCKFTPEMFSKLQTSKYGRTINQAYQLGKSTYNCETHLPRVYKRDNLKEMFRKFPFQEMNIPYSLATLYFSLYPDILPTLYENNDYKAGFEGFTGRIGTFKQDTIEDIENAVKDKVWMNYNDTGLFWNPKEYPLQKWIINNFPNKCKYENT